MAVINLNFKRFKIFHEFKLHKLTIFLFTYEGLPNVLLTFALSNAHSTPFGASSGKLIN